jgi:hypothetical protein
VAQTAAGQTGQIGHASGEALAAILEASHPELGTYHLACDGDPSFLVVDMSALLRSGGYRVIAGRR